MGRPSFVGWLSAVEEFLARHRRSIDDFDDRYWRSMYEQSFTPEEAARQALETRMVANGTYRDKWRASVEPVPEKDWLVTRVVDYGPKEFYRYGVEGENLNFLPEDIDYHFRWRVPDLDNPRYDLSRAERRERYSPNPRHDDDDFDDFERDDFEGPPHACLRGEMSPEYSWWEHDAQGIPLARVCDTCRSEKLGKYRPEILSGYGQDDVDEPIEPDD